EREHHVAVIDLRPPELRLQRRLQDPDHLAIDVIDRRREEEERADRPAKAPDPRGRRRDCVSPVAWHCHSVSPSVVGRNYESGIRKGAYFFLILNSKFLIPPPQIVVFRR